MALAPAPLVQALHVEEFAGGLNLRADAFQLNPADGESPDMLNVDLGFRGGIVARDAAGVFADSSTGVSAVPKNIWSFATASGATEQVLIQQGDDFAYSTGGGFTAVNPDALTCTGKMRACTFKDLCFIQRNAEAEAVKWTGSAATVLGTAFNDDITTPTGANMPKAKCIAAHMGSVWVANTVEAGTAHGSRIRWSHPNQPADFMTNSYIDIDTGHDGDEIVALVPSGDRLVVFKRRSMHVVFGNDSDTFNVVPVSDHVGAISQEAVCATDSGVYFFSWPNGLMLYSGSGPTWVFERIQPAIQDGSITAADQDLITVGWVNRRVWVSVPWAAVGSGFNGRVFVLDPSLARRVPHRRTTYTEGGWTAYDLPLGPFLAWQRPGQNVAWLVCNSHVASVLKLHQTNVTYDTLSSGVTRGISSYYVTRWFDAGDPARIKRWKRPEFVLRGGQTSALRVDVYHDYDAGEIKRTLTIPLAVRGAGGKWDTDNWDQFVWAGDSLESEVIARTGVLGRSRAVRLKVAGPLTVGGIDSIKWQLDDITLKFIPMRMRG